MYLKRAIWDKNLVQCLEGFPGTFLTKSDGHLFSSINLIKFIILINQFIQIYEFKQFT